MHQVFAFINDIKKIYKPREFTIATINLTIEEELKEVCVIMFHKRFQIRFSTQCHDKAWALAKLYEKENYIF